MKDKKPLLKAIAKTGYNVGFGAKKHFATYDIVEKLPNWLSFITIVIGIIQISYNNLLFSKELSIFLIIIGVGALYVNFYNQEKENYCSRGTDITNLFYELRDLYLSVKNSNKDNYEVEYNKMKKIVSEFQKKSITKQIFLSDWYAHYKFFYQMQTEWIDEQLNFSFLKDKFPRSLLIILLFLLISSGTIIIIY